MNWVEHNKQSALGDTSVVMNQPDSEFATSSASDLGSPNRHASYIASLLLSAYQEFLEKHRMTIDTARQPIYNRDKNICAGDKAGRLS